MGIRSHFSTMSLIGTLAVLPQLAFAQTAAPGASPMNTVVPVQTVNINSASKSQLMALEGMGDNRSEAIIRARPYKSKDELVNRGMVPAGLYEKIQAQIVLK